MKHRGGARPARPTLRRPADAAARDGTRVPLLRVALRSDGIEGVRLNGIAMDVETGAAIGRVLLIHDRDGDGEADADDPEIASAPLTSGAVTRVAFAPADFVVPAEGDADLLVAARIAAGSPNGAVLRAVFAPSGTSSLNIRSMRQNRLTQPGEAVASATVRLSVLGAAVLSMSENPVRSPRVIFNFTSRPSAAAVYGIDGRRIADLLRLDGGNRMEWDLTNDEGARVVPGVYLVVFDIDGRVHREKLVIARRGENDGRPRAPAADPS